MDNKKDTLSSGNCIIRGDFIRLNNPDPEFKHIPFRAEAVLKRQVDCNLHPFSEYSLRFYQKYDPESYETALTWNKRFSEKQLKEENKFIEDMLKSCRRKGN